MKELKDLTNEELLELRVLTMECAYHYFITIGQYTQAHEKLKDYTNELKEEIKNRNIDFEDVDLFIKGQKLYTEKGKDYIAKKSSEIYVELLDKEKK